MASQMETVPRISHVLPEPGYRLRLAFNNGEIRTVDLEKFMVTPWLDELRDPEYFRQVRVIEGGWGVEWPNEQDFSRDTLYLNSRRVRFKVQQEGQVKG